MGRRDDVIEHAARLGYEYERVHRGCAQCTVAAVQDPLYIGNDEVFKAATGLAAGGGGTCAGTCGALSGGIMVMSTCFGRTRDSFDSDVAGERCAPRLSRELFRLFRDRYNATTCSGIHNKIFGRTFDLWDDGDSRAFDDAGAHEDKCTSVVANASRWTTQLILEELDRRGITLEELRSAPSISC